MKLTTTEILARFGPCNESLAWMAAHPDPREAWQTCERGDWMVFAWERLEFLLEQRKLIALAAARCARLEMSYVRDGHTYASKRAEILARCADIVREFIPEPPAEWLEEVQP